jgi:hypothetical protein
VVELLSGDQDLLLKVLKREQRLVDWRTKVCLSATQKSRASSEPGSAPFVVKDEASHASRYELRIDIVINLVIGFNLPWPAMRSLTGPNVWKTSNRKAHHDNKGLHDTDSSSME